MDNEHYETVIKFLNGALTMLQCAHDEVIEFAVTGLERQLALHIHKQVLSMNRLSNRVINHHRVLLLTAKGDALRAP